MSFDNVQLAPKVFAVVATHQNSGMQFRVTTATLPRVNRIGEAVFTFAKMKTVKSVNLLLLNDDSYGSAILDLLGLAFGEKFSFEIVAA